MAHPLLAALRMQRHRALALGLGILGISSTVHAGTGLTLDPGKLNVTATLEVNMSESAVGKPTSIAPDISYGVNEALTLSLVHSTFMTTGFRGAAGRGLCVTGSDNGCAKVYNNVGAEALYGLAAGAFSFAANAGFHALNLDAGFYAAKVGGKLRYTAGPFALSAAPSVFLAVNKRDTNKDALFVPVLAQYKVIPALALGLGSGIKGPFSGFGDAWEVSLGVSATYAVLPALTIGGSWTFGKLVGGAGDAATGPEFRAVQAWVSYTR